MLFLAFLIALLLLTSAPPLQAQLLPFQYYTVDNGLLSNATSTMYQNSSGDLLIGSAEGLSVFDGYSFTHYRTRDGLPSNFINCIYEQRSSPGIIWLGTNNGISRFSGNRFSTMLLDTTERSRLVLSIREDVAQRLWCGTFGGLYIVGKDSITKIILEVDVVHQIEVLEPSLDSLVYVVVNNELLEFSLSGDLVHRIFFDPSDRKRITAAFRDRRRNIWIGLGDSTLSLYRDGILLHKRHTATGGQPLYIMDDPDGNLHVGTEDGLLSVNIEQFGHGEFEKIGPKNGLQRGRIIGGTVDREGTLWFLCKDAGISKLRTRALQVFPLPDIPEAYNNGRGAVDSAGHYWVISGDRLVEIQRTGKRSWIVKRHSVGVTRKTGKPNSVVCDGWNRLWVGFKEFGLHCYRIRADRKEGTKLILLNSVEVEQTPSNPLLAFMVDRSDQLWCSYGVSLIDHHRNVVIRKYTPADGIPDLDVRTLCEDGAGNIWIGGYTSGIAIVPRGPPDVPLRTMTTLNGLPTGFVRAFCEDQDGNMWVGTRYSGCMIIGQDSILVLSTANGLPSDAVWSIARDKQGTMWLGTSLGLVAIDATTRMPKLVGENLVRDPVVALGVSPSGEIWFVTPTAFGVIDGTELHASLSAPDVRISAMEVDEQFVEIAEGLELPYDRNSCSFRFLATTFRNTQDVRYQYKLHGVDDNWQQPTAQRSVTYASLPPGMYSFEVRATRLGMTEYSRPAGVSFTITSAFWQQWWFRAGAAAMVIAVIARSYRRRITALKREQQAQQEFSRQLLESQENERKRIAGELHDSLGQDLLVIRNRALLGLKDGALSKHVHDQLDQISSVATQAIDGVREISYDLRPYQLDRLGLTKAITSIASGLDDSSSIRFSIDAEPIDEEVAKDRAIHVYRIVQEGINNIVKHAGASDAQVVIRVEADNIRMTISDNGKGMPAVLRAGSDDRPGFGLVGIAERARVLNGSVTIESSPGKGTRLTVTIPRKRGNSPDR